MLIRCQNLNEKCVINQRMDEFRCIQTISPICDFYRGEMIFSIL